MRSTRWRSLARRCAKASTGCPRRSWRAPSLICGCWSTIASGSFAAAWRSTTTCSGTCTTSGPSSKLPGSGLVLKKWSTAVGRRLARTEQTARVRIARDELRRLRELTGAVDALEAEISALVAHVAPHLLAEPGVGALTAAKLVGEIAGANRFSTEA